ncbi:carbonic anhydrase [Streptomyces triculaminicus]|nr:carbonic anhydrase [Streptomyces triculaminicus]
MIMRARRDVSASVSLFLAAVPLSLGIALACGAPLWAGPVAVAVGGLAAGAFGGASLRASGAATGLIVVTAELVQRHGWRAMCAITVLAGAAQLVLGAVRMARPSLMGRALPAIGPPIVRGLLAATGVTIVLGRLPAVLGSRPNESALGNLAALPADMMRAHLPTLLVGAATVAVLVAWPRLPAPAARWARPAPAAFVALAVATATGLFVDVASVTASPWALTALPALPDEPALGLLGAVVMVVLVASAETPGLSARAFAGQGVANVVSGLLGGLPVAGGAIHPWRHTRPSGEDESTAGDASRDRAPSSAEDGPTRSAQKAAGEAAGEEGSRAATVLYGVWALLCAALFTAAFAWIPAVALAVLITAVGVRMVRFAHLRHARRQGDFAVYAATLGAVVLFGVLQGVIVGISVTALLALRRRWAGFRSRYGQAVADAVDAHRCLPWTPWRQHDCTRPADAEADTAEIGGERQLLGGVSAFQRNTAPLVRDELARLAREGQRPSQLFLTCADSRLVTSMITSSGPGDLFTVRNVGNLMPPPGSDASCDSVAAAVEYAVEVLKVGSITVCGHSGCGAMQALLDLAASPAGHGLPGGGQTPLTRWLRHGRPSLARMQRIGRLGRGEVALAERLVADDVERLALVNVMQQLDHLMAHACVARRVAEGSLQLHGMYFHVGEAQAYVLDRRSRTFTAVRPEVLDAA